MRRCAFPPRCFAAAVLLLASAATGGRAETPARHLGVVSCAGSNCHGAFAPVKGSAVRQDEYLIWSQDTDPARIDKHHQAYQVLLGKRARRIARNLGLADAAAAPLCLNCHADNARPDQRGPQFDIADGVGCEACHGGASTWLGVHLSGKGHRANLAAGLYPLEDPLRRAEKCLSCHFGDPANDQRFVTHRLMGAGHPRMPFELDTFTLAQPAHFVVNKTYVERKGPVSDVRVWAVGQAASLVVRMDALSDPKLAPKGVNPELVLFDCESCHHAADDLRWQRRASTGLGPGRLVLYDANAVMLGTVAARVAPELAKQLHTRMLALHRATIENWDAVVREAKAVRGLAQDLETRLAHRDFGADDLKALAASVAQLGLNGDAAAFSGAEQETFALGAIASNMRMSGLIGDAQVTPVNGALRGLDRVIANDQTYRPGAFLDALQALRRALLLSGSTKGPQ